MTNQDQASCWIRSDLPPPVAGAYEPQGEWKEIGELKSYTTGPKTSTRALIFIYDIFGISPQSLQGADRLSQYLDALVVMPDFFKGNSLNALYEGLDPYGPEKVEIRRRFMKEHAAFDTNSSALIDLVPAIREVYPSVHKVGAFGLCWGGKVAVLGSIGEPALFHATGQAHPGGLDKEDAKALTVPHICLASKDEAKDVVADYAEILSKHQGSIVETYDKMFHGWMGARANLEDEENRKEYERGYRQVAGFFSRYL